MAMQPDNPLTSYRTTDAKLFDISEETLDIYSNVTTLKIEKVNNIVELDMILESFPKVVSVEIELLTANAYELPYSAIPLKIQWLISVARTTIIISNPSDSLILKQQESVTSSLSKASFVKLTIMK
jgi:hypothetical protein